MSLMLCVLLLRHVSLGVAAPDKYARAPIHCACCAASGTVRNDRICAPRVLPLLWVASPRLASQNGVVGTTAPHIVPGLRAARYSHPRAPPCPARPTIARCRRRRLPVAYAPGSTTSPSLWSRVQRHALLHRCCNGICDYIAIAPGHLRFLLL